MYTRIQWEDPLCDDCMERVHREQCPTWQLAARGRMPMVLRPCIPSHSCGAQCAILTGRLAPLKLPLHLSAEHRAECIAERITPQPIGAKTCCLCPAYVAKRTPSKAPSRTHHRAHCRTHNITHTRAHSRAHSRAHRRAHTRSHSRSHSMGHNIAHDKTSAEHTTTHNT